MKISDIYRNNKQPISFEIFPPKGTLDINSFCSILDEIADLKPNFISVTYSAGGSGESFSKTVALASIIKEKYRIESVAHITCVNSTESQVKEIINGMHEHNIENVLALRGDKIENTSVCDFHYAKDLIPMLKEENFCVGGGCYPEGHVECISIEEDLKHLKEKQDAGAEFFLSQLFFDNKCFYDFVEKARKIGIDKPLIPGIMPILSKSQISRMIFMCGASLPAEIIRLLNRYENSAEDLKKAGIDYASKQISDLLKNGSDGVHIYTMNKPEIAKKQMHYLHEGCNE